MKTLRLTHRATLAVLALSGLALMAAPGASAGGSTISSILGTAEPGNSVSGFALVALGGDSSEGIDCSLATINGNTGLGGPGKFTNAAPCTERRFRKSTPMPTPRGR